MIRVFQVRIRKHEECRIEGEIIPRPSGVPPLTAILNNVEERGFQVITVILTASVDDFRFYEVIARQVAEAAKPAADSKVRVIQGNEIRSGDTIIAKDGHQGVVVSISVDDEKDCDTASIGFGDDHAVEYRASDIAVLVNRPEPAGS